MADTPDWENFAPASASKDTPAWENFEPAPSPALPGVSADQYTDPSKPGSYDISQDWADKTKDIGFSPEFSHALGMDGMNPSVAAKLFGKINQVLTSPLIAAQYGMAGIETAANAADAGLSDIGYRTGLNKALGTNRLNPLNTALDVANSAGAETQLINGAPHLAPAVSDAEITSNIQGIIKSGGTAEDVRNYVKSYGGDPSALKGVDEAVAAQNKGGAFGVAVEDNKLNPAISNPSDTPVPDNPLAQQAGLPELPNTKSAAERRAYSEAEQRQIDANDRYEAAKAQGSPEEIRQAYNELLQSHGKDPLPDAVPQVDDTQNPDALINNPEQGDLFGGRVGGVEPTADSPGGVVQIDGQKRLDDLLDTIKPVGGTREQVINYKIRQLQQEMDGATPGDAAAIQEEILDYESIREKARSLDNGVGEDQRLSRAQLSEAHDELKASVLNGEITPEEAQARISAARNTGNTGAAIDALDTPTSDVVPSDKVVQQTGHTPEEIDSAVDRITQQLDEAVKNRTEAEGLLAENRKAQAERLQRAIDEAGENGSDTERLIKMREALKGKTDRPALQSIRDQLDPEDLNRLSSRIMVNPKLQAFEKFRSANAFSKLIDGEHLQPNELLLLNRTFPAPMLKGFIKNGEDLRANGLQGQGELFQDGETLSTGPIRELKPEAKPVDPDRYVYDKNQGEMFPNTREQKPFAPTKNPKVQPPEKKPGILTQALSLPRSLMATLDLSAPLRQGIFMVGRKEFYPAFASMFKQFGSKKAFDAVNDSIHANPNYSLMEKAGLAITKMDGGFTQHEEAFSGDWAGKIPIFGRAHQASERAYTGFLNKLRADSFSSIADKYKTAGIDLNDPANAKALHDLGKYVNAATGRGNLHGKWEAAAGALSTALFSPRLIASRVSLLNPKYYVDLDPLTRKEAVRDLLAFGSIAGTVAGLAAAGGAKVEADPRSSDFAKIRVGNTRYDILGGFGQYLTLGARLVSGESKKSDGTFQDYTSGKFGQPTRLDALSNFTLNKAAPVPSFVIDFLRGKDAVGTPFSARKEIASRFVPLFLQDLKDVTDDQGYAKGLPMAAPGVFGVGIQTYQPRAAKPSTPVPDWENFTPRNK